MIDTNHAYGVADAIRARARPRGHGLEAALVRGAGHAGGPRRLRRGAPRARHADRRRRERVHPVRLPRTLRARARSTSRSRTSAPPAASPAAATSSRSRTRTACRSTRTSGPRRSARPHRCSSSPRSRSRTTRSSRASRCSSSTRPRTRSANDLTDSPLRQQNGWVEIPQRPGLGIEVSREIAREIRSAVNPANLLIIMSDEHDPRWMGCSGSAIAITPNLDRLAARGTRFTDAYTTCPICVPARAAFAVGKYTPPDRLLGQRRSLRGHDPELAPPPARPGPSRRLGRQAPFPLDATTTTASPKRSCR